MLAVFAVSRIVTWTINLVSTFPTATSNFFRQAIISLPEQEIQKAATFFLDECLLVFGSFSKRDIYANPISRKSLIDIIITLVQHNESVPLTVAINILTKAFEIEKDIDVKNHSLNALSYLNSYVNPKRHVRVISERSGLDLLSTKASFTNNSESKNFSLFYFTHFYSP